MPTKLYTVHVRAPGCILIGKCWHHYGFENDIEKSITFLSIFLLSVYRYSLPLQDGGKEGGGGGAKKKGDNRKCRSLPIYSTKGIYPSRWYVSFSGGNRNLLSEARQFFPVSKSGRYEYV